MPTVWAAGDAGSAQHPIGGRDEGHDAVIASFARVAGIAGGGEIPLHDQRIDAGTDTAVETGVETGTLVIAGHRAALHHRVTNVCRRGESGWKLAHHHADLSEAMPDFLKRPNAAA